jgi:hypothetical protein
MSWKCEVFAENEWAGNALVFEQKSEAYFYGKDLLNRWFVPTAHRAVEINDPINYVWDVYKEKAVRLDK